MTTIIGIKANSGVEGIVLGADTQLSFIGESDGKIRRKKAISKIVYGKDWAISFCGSVTEELYRFFQLLKKPEKSKEMLERALKNYEVWRENPRTEEIHFPEINNLNASLKREDLSLKDLNKFILATNTNSHGPRLFEIDELGNLKEAPKGEMQYITVGSGRKIVKNYIKEVLDKEEGSPSIVSLSRAIDIVRKSLSEAQRDPYTNAPIDLIVLTATGLEYHGKPLRDVLSRAENQYWDEVKQKYVPPQS